VRRPRTLPPRRMPGVGTRVHRPGVKGGAAGLELAECRGPIAHGPGGRIIALARRQPELRPGPHTELALQELLARDELALRARTVATAREAANQELLRALLERVERHDARGQIARAGGVACREPLEGLLVHPRLACAGEVAPLVYEPGLERRTAGEGHAGEELVVPLGQDRFAAPRVGQRQNVDGGVCRQA
jgi:hypothetical protein